MSEYQPSTEMEITDRIIDEDTLRGFVQQSAQETEQQEEHRPDSLNWLGNRLSSAEGKIRHSLGLSQPTSPTKDKPISGPVPSLTPRSPNPNGNLDKASLVPLKAVDDSSEENPARKTSNGDGEDEQGNRRSISVKLEKRASETGGPIPQASVAELGGGSAFLKQPLHSVDGAGQDQRLDAILDTGKSEESEDSAQGPSFVSQCCQKIWGGPVAPMEDDTIHTWTASYFSGITTAHGINRVWDDDNGYGRKIFWFCLFFLSFIMLVFQLEATFDQFLKADIATNVDWHDADNVLPMMTVCSVSPIRCGCEAFYAPEIINNPTYLERVAPFICREQVAFDITFSGGVENGRRTDFQVLEHVEGNVNYAKTKQRIQAFNDTLFCDHGPYTKDWMIQKIMDGNLSQYDLLQYAGYHDRGRLVRFCSSTDPHHGNRVSCMDDRYWSPAKANKDYGMCHTLNPCHGFPVGKTCEKDDECQHASGSKRVAGSFCNAQKVCECSLCKAGSDCKVMEQLKPGKEQGVRIIVNTGRDQDAAINSARRSQLNPGVVLHLHSKQDEESLSHSLSAGPGQVTQLLVYQKRDIYKSHPFTNCSENSITETTACEANCLSRVQAMRCCGMALSPVEDGRFVGLEHLGPDELVHNLSNPVLSCNVLDPEVQMCFNRQAERMAEGTICLDAALGDKTKFHPLGVGIDFLMFAKNRIGWYDGEPDKDEDEIPDQEEESWKVKKNCVWGKADRQLPAGGEESRYGMECEEHKDCKSDTGEDERQGTCFEAYRAFCPGPCDALSFGIESHSNIEMSETAATIIAAAELEWVTHQYEELGYRESRRWQPLCKEETINNVTSYIDTPDCFTLNEAEALVKRNYAVLNVDYERFQEQVVSKDEKVPVVDLLGTVGGNLGMWVGLSIMTIFEFFELAIFALISIPFFFFGIRRLPWIRKAVPTPATEDEEILRILKNLKNMAQNRNNFGDLAQDMLEKKLIGTPDEANLKAEMGFFPDGPPPTAPQAGKEGGGEHV